MMYLIGLTGSIGMGKTQTAALFEEEGVPRYDADAAVHGLYEVGGAAVGPIGELFPEAVRDGAVDRAALGRIVLKDGAKLAALEKMVHPLAGATQVDFLNAQMAAGATHVLLDIPLLFETGGHEFVDCVVVVSAPPDIQRARVLERPGMTEEKFADILAKQVPDSDKRAAADFIVDSSVSVADAHRQVKEILAAVRDRKGTVLQARLDRAQVRDK
ncbi:MAG: dephospho-CoA kinase [Pseudomonadota bacterium]|jgi:dephospho-CoA kinase|nr:dephospho-CoA kinase [Pseudomonadota bacterium]MEC8585918.1 dephospho-CoA kinase [Pseudomonadota bacterium]MEE3120061.1 dephospho-CoA kinase [Pseudomonadota bacterium]